VCPGKAAGSTLVLEEKQGPEHGEKNGQHGGGEQGKLSIDRGREGTSFESRNG
jgi:hypothetical protein